MYIAVDPDDVGAAAVLPAHLANAMANIDLGADLASLALALPGSSVGAALPDLGARWAVWVGGLREAAGLQGGALRHAGASYAAAEDSSRAALSAGRHRS